MKHANRIITTVIFLTGTIVMIFVTAPRQASADDYADTIHADIAVLKKEDPVGMHLHAPNLILTERSLLSVHGASGVKKWQGDIHRSTDKGRTWQHQYRVESFRCGSFFQIGETVYLLYSTFKPEPGTFIRKSQDNGKSWSDPVEIWNNNLWEGNGAYAVHNGFLYKALDEPKPKNGHYHLPRVLKLNIKTDPMVAKNWIFSDYPNFDIPPPKPVMDYQVANGRVTRNNSEGSCVVGPDGKLWIIYRHFERTRGIFSATVFYNDKDNTQHFRNVFDPNPKKGKENCYSIFPGACSGFHIARDPVTGQYIALSNPVTGESEYPDRKRLGIYRLMRNVLVMMESEDLVHWRIAKHLLKDGLEPDWETSVKNTGFQQINFQIDGNDLVWISRTAYDGAKNLHDGNRITFHRLPDFRQYLDSDDEIAYYSFDDPENPGNDQCKQAGPGSGNKLTPHNVTITDGCLGKAAAFNGKDAFMDAHYRISTEFHRAPAVTLACWLYVAKRPEKDQSAFIFKSSIDKGYGAVNFIIKNSQLQIGGRSCRQDRFSSLRHPFEETGKWVHAAAICNFKTKTLQLFLNGKQVAKGNAAFDSNLLQRGIPKAKDVIGRNVNGRIDELHIYRRALNADEINQLMKP